MRIGSGSAHRAKAAGLIGSVGTLVTAVALTSAPLALAGPVAGPAPAGATEVASMRGGALVPVIVRYDQAAPAAARQAAERAVARAGGQVGQRLTTVGALTARVPAGALAALRGAPGVRAVTADGKVRLTGKDWNGDTDPSNKSNENNVYSVASAAGAPTVWAKSDSAGNKITGKGIGVALIDSGIAPVTGLADPAKVINGPDLSFESQAPNLRHLDTFGHGTHMAGIIAGRDPGITDTQLTSGKGFVGIAPGANLINMKVAAADGAVDVSQVIAAIDWVVTHRKDPGLNIRVLNLSFGTDSAQDPRLDPLSHAVEAAWRNGIVVVVAVGNDGAATTRVNMPAANPYVIAVGGANSNGTATRNDDTVADFSTRGNATRHADLVATGKTVISLRNPGSYIDVNYPSGLVPGDPTGRFFRGSGTSQATAVVSGAAALLLQQRPTLTPDQVKRLLMTNTDAMPKADAISAGAGQLNIAKAASAAVPTFKQAYPASLGTGSLELSRGTSHVADPSNGIELTGEQDIMGRRWAPATWAPMATAGTAWVAGTWNGDAWGGDAWTGTSWATRTWSARTWTGRTWTGVNWAGRTWAGSAWTGRTWTGRTWTGRTWTGRTWTGRTWTGGVPTSNPPANNPPANNPPVDNSPISTPARGGRATGNPSGILPR
jgi:serine protease AprX